MVHQVIGGGGRRTAREPKKGRENRGGRDRQKMAVKRGLFSKMGKKMEKKKKKIAATGER